MVTRLNVVIARLALALGLVTAVLSPAIGAETIRHAYALVGVPKYPVGFAATDYADPSARTGGHVRVGALGTFDSFNIALAGVKGNIAPFVFNLFEPLMGVSLDEPATQYGLLAEHVVVPDDISSATFRIRAGARWHDGRPVTPEDVIFSFETLKTMSAQFNRYYRDVVEARQTGERDVTFLFGVRHSRILPFVVGELVILPKHWWTGRDAAGMPRDVQQTTLEPPLGSGPYRVAAFEPGRSVTFERVRDYWGAAVPLRRGTENFDGLTVEMFRDDTVLFEAFRAGRLDFRRELDLKRWATGYDLAATRDGSMLRETFPIERFGILRALAFNMRRGPLRDPGFRRALAIAFDFEQMNRLAFHGLLEPGASFFPSTAFAATDPPGDGERALAAKLGAPLDPLPMANPASTGDAGRRRLRVALGLLREAGYRLSGDRLVDAGGRAVVIELLVQDAAAERYLANYIAALEKLGIVVRFRLVDDVQYQNRVRSFDFDLAVHSWAQSHSPGAEQREYWNSTSAGTPGTHNLPGISDPAIDRVVERFVEAPDDDARIAAGRLLDRLLRNGHYVVPLWTERTEYAAYWKRITHPKVMPRYGAAAFPSLWWWSGDAGVVSDTRR